MQLLFEPVYCKKQNLIEVFTVCADMDDLTWVLKFIEFIKQVGGRDKMGGLSSIWSLFRNKLNSIIQEHEC